MINRRTVLVLGAGAAAPYGFPSGQRLADLICHVEIGKMERAGVHSRDYDRFREALTRSGCSSVDSFLESRPEYLNIGKIAIATVLLPIERTSKLFDEWSSIRLRPNISEDYRRNWPWYDFLLGVLCNGVPLDAIGDNLLSVITFNYDRSLEHFLFTAIKNRYGIPDNKCAALLERMAILHVYGNLGKLEWQEDANEKNTVPYDSNGETEYVERTTQNIMIIHEGTDNTREFLAARELLGSAEQVLFLGFGYHRTNVARLGIGPQFRLPMGSCGTALGLSKDTREHFRRLTVHQRDTRKAPGEDSVCGGINLIEADSYTLLHNHITFE